MKIITPAQIEIARAALAAHDNPALPLTGPDGFPLIGSVERAEEIIKRLRPLVEAFPEDEPGAFLNSRLPYATEWRAEVTNGDTMMGYDEWYSRYTADEEV